MKRPEKRVINTVDGKFLYTNKTGYNECHDDFTAFMPSEEEWHKIICKAKHYDEIVPLIHKRLA